MATSSIRGLGRVLGGRGVPAVELLGRCAWARTGCRVAGSPVEPSHGSGGGGIRRHGLGLEGSCGGRHQVDRTWVPSARWTHGEGPAASALVSAAFRSSGTSRLASSSPSELRQEFCDRRVLGWSQDKIYKMVADIDKYEAFLPWCSSSKVLTSNEHGCTAEIGVGFPPIHETYISKVTLDPSQTSIHAVASNSKLFKELVNTWSFAPGPSNAAGPTTYVDIAVVYEFRNPMHALLAAAAFDEVARQMIRAFEKRAMVLYGQPGRT